MSRLWRYLEGMKLWAAVLWGAPRDRPATGWRSWLRAALLREPLWLDTGHITEESLQQTLAFDSPTGNAGRGYARTVLILEDDVPAGMALYFYNYSTWRARPGRGRA